MYIHIVDPDGMTLMFPDASSSFAGGARNPFAESCEVGRKGPEGCQQLPDPCLNRIYPYPRLSLIFRINKTQTLELKTSPCRYRRTPMDIAN